MTGMSTYIRITLLSAMPVVHVCMYVCISLPAQLFSCLRKKKKKIIIIIHKISTVCCVDVWLKNYICIYTALQ